MVQGMRAFYDQYNFNVGKSPFHEDPDALPDSVPETTSVKAIAYYLPQFHTIPENDAWWGKGFTEWTNVTKAVPRYRGHWQPRLPADLGFYDLSQLETIQRQADLVRRSGLHGVCIHNYWFSGRQVLETPLNLLLANPDVDLRFCLNWANENWSRRWDGRDQDVLLEQKHAPGDDLSYIRSILPALRDPRYIRVNGRPLIMIYRPGLLPDARATVAIWREALNAEGLGDPYIIMPQAYGDTDPRPYGMDAAAGFPPHNAGWGLPNRRSSVRLLDPDFQGTVCSYEAMAERSLANATDAFRLLPGVCPAWDNEARKPGRGFGFYGASPPDYGRWLKAAVGQARRCSDPEERIVFINAWNEWAEGACLEPDRHFGHAYLAETRRVLCGEAEGATPGPAESSVRRPHPLMDPDPSGIKRVTGLPARLWGRARSALRR